MKNILTLPWVTLNHWTDKNIELKVKEWSIKIYRVELLVSNFMFELENITRNLTH